MIEYNKDHKKENIVLKREFTILKRKYETELVTRQEILEAQNIQDNFTIEVRNRVAVAMQEHYKTYIEFVKEIKELIKEINKLK